MWSTGGVGDGTRRVLEHVNDAHAVTYHLVRKLAGGARSGAYEVRDATGGRAVLKWSTDVTWTQQVLRAAPVVDRMRGAGWPTPRWLAFGVTPDGYPYQLQEYVLGQPLHRLDGPALRVLLDLVDSHHGLDPDPGRNWSAFVSEVVFDDRDGAREGARRVDPDAARLADQFMTLCAPHRQHRLPSTDLVHGDLHPGNVLVADGRVVGVIDVEAIGSGTRAIDLAPLLATAYAQGASPRTVATLGRAAAAPAGPAGLVLCTAASFFTMTMFLARHNSPALPDYYAATSRLLVDLNRGFS
jgi:aminoglycoside phosphotransferase (APT) family kinase protein